MCVGVCLIGVTPSAGGSKVTRDLLAVLMRLVDTLVGVSRMALSAGVLKVSLARTEPTGVPTGKASRRALVWADPFGGVMPGDAGAD